MMVIVMLSLGPLARSLAGRGEGALDSPEGGAILLIVADDRAGLGGGYRRGPAGVPAVRAGGSGRVGMRSAAAGADLGGGAVAAASARALPGGGVRGDARVVAGRVFAAAL